MREIILVPIDFSEVAKCAMDHASQLALSFQRKVVLLHVVGKKVAGTPKETVLEDKLKENAKWIRERATVDVSYVIEEGSIFTTIAEVADRLRAEFIVMGIHGKKGVQHIMGSYAYDVVCSSNVPVLLVKRFQTHTGFKNIVLPVDFSAESTQKVIYSVKFARFFGAKISVFGFLNTKNSALVIKKNALLKKVKNIYKEFETEVTTHLCINPEMDLSEAILEFSDKVNADLIMIVAEKDGGIPDIFGQNTTELLIDKADLPILTVMPVSDPEDTRLTDVVRSFVDPLGVINGKITSKYFIN